MNDARKIYQTKKQSDFQQDIYRRYLYDIKEHKLCSEIIEIIVSYVPIDLVFDLMDIKTPFDFFYSTKSLKYERHTESTYISIYVS